MKYDIPHYSMANLKIQHKGVFAMNESTTNMRSEEAIKEKIKESRFESINGKDLMEMDLPPLHYTISTILPHGFFILAGGAKVGKSWLAEQISYAVASGGQIWGYQAIQSEGLYLRCLKPMRVWRTSTSF